MKILLLYTPRSGSTSILNYYTDLYPTHKTSNFPFRFKKFANSKHLNYDEIESLSKLSRHTNLFVKNEISIIFRNEGRLGDDFSENYILGDFTKCPTFDELRLVFDKIVILTRRNLIEQAESTIYASNASTETSDNMFHTKMQYQTSSNEFNKNKVDRVIYKNKLSNEIIEDTLKEKYNVYYYEDLYINSEFNNFFNDLGIEYDEVLFNKHLSLDNKYRLLNNNTKNKTSLI